MRELVPSAGKLVILLNPTNANARTYVTDAMEAGRKLNLSISVAEVARAEDFQNAFAMIRETRPDALLIMSDPFISEHRAEVLAFAAGARLPANADVPDFSRAGGLIAYGPLLSEHYVMGAGYVDRIFKGAKPADLPVEQPTRFELVINLKTATALGLTVPQSLLQRADEVVK
jgi:putative ABC transport system substrate-binding protein